MSRVSLSTCIKLECSQPLRIPWGTGTVTCPTCGTSWKQNSQFGPDTFVRINRNRREMEKLFETLDKQKELNDWLSRLKF